MQAMQREGETNLVTSAENDTSLQGKGKRIGRCAFCFRANVPVKLCGGCRKRAYCSRQCQVDDWKLQPPNVIQRGQGHKNWCLSNECGEEDIDWAVVPVPGKGLGVVAKRLLPSKYRIIVECIFTDPNGHPGVSELVPDGGTIEEKFELNSISGDRAFGKGHGGMVGLRISRVNHDCDPNAAHRYDETARVIVLFAQRDIQPGEEICISYIRFNDVNAKRTTVDLGMTAEEEFHYCEKWLNTKFGITCRPDCFCKNVLVKELVVKGRQLSADVVRFAAAGKVVESLQSVDALNEIHEQIRSTLIEKACTHFTAFQVCIMRRETLIRAKDHIQTVYDLYSVIGPYSKLTRDMEDRLNNHQVDVNYLALEPK